MGIIWNYIVDGNEEFNPKEFFIDCFEYSDTIAYIFIDCKNKILIRKFHKKIGSLLVEKGVNFIKSGYAYQGKIIKKDISLILNSFELEGNWSISIYITNFINEMIEVNLSCQLAFIKDNGTEKIQFSFDKQLLTEAEENILNEQFGFKLIRQEQV